MENLTIAFIGSGNIASSMIGGLITNGINPEKLIAADSDKTQQQLIADKYGVRVYDKNYDAAKEADVIIFAVKPQIMQQVVKEISKNIEVKNKLILSVAAGIKICSIDAEFYSISISATSLQISRKRMFEQSSDRSFLSAAFDSSTEIS